MMLLRETMRLDIYIRAPWWKRLWHWFRPLPPPPKQTITHIDHERRIVTYGPAE